MGRKKKILFDVGGWFQQVFMKKFGKKIHNKDWCCFPKCKSESDLVYIGFPFCNNHFDWAIQKIERRLRNEFSCTKE